MKKVLFLSSMLILSSALFAQLQVNPQVGLNFMTFSDAPEGISYESKVGYSLGADLRIGERFQFQPGAHWVHSATAVVADDGAVTTEDVVHQYVKLKALAAYNIVDGSEFKFRVNAGPTYDFLVNAETNDSNTDLNDEFTSGTFFLQGGVGIDFLFLTLDVGYSHGLTSTFDGQDAPDSNTSGFYVNAGIIFGSGKK